jgi:hypothetical protein
MSKWPMRGHFRYLRFKTFPMTSRILQCEVFWALLSNSKHSGVPKDSKSPTLEVLGFTPTLGQSGVATFNLMYNSHHVCVMMSYKAIIFEFLYKVLDSCGSSHSTIVVKCFESFLGHPSSESNN